MTIRAWIEARLCSPIYRECVAAFQLDGWTFDRFNATHKSGLALWTATGWTFLQLQPDVAGASLSLLDKWMLRRWIHLARARSIRAQTQSVARLAGAE